MTEPVPEMKLETIPIVTAAKTEKRISLLLCSPSGYGKTTLADSAPRKKLWLLFGSSEIASGKDVLIADFTRSPAEIIEKFEDQNPFNISKILPHNPEIETVVFDSVRAFGDLPLRNVVHAARKGTISESLSPGASLWHGCGSFAELFALCRRPAGVPAGSDGCSDCR
jgi:hypothetical protein